mgnify:CR=1 FL=1
MRRLIPFSRANREAPREARVALFVAVLESSRQPFVVVVVLLVVVVLEPPRDVAVLIIRIVDVVPRGPLGVLALARLQCAREGRGAAGREATHTYI